MSGQTLALGAWSALAGAAALAIALVLVLLVRALRARRLATLEPWHADRVADELRAADYAARPSFEELRERERRLVRAVESRLARPGGPALDRYRPGGRRAPGERNLSFLLEAEPPRFGVLLLHGLTDSPYFMRPLGDALHRRGATVLALRLPGHGTAPGGLLSTRWQDWRAAADYGAAELRRRLDGRPMWIAGFSTGATLALRHSLEAVLHGSHAVPAGLFFLSPAMELPLAARFALWHRTLAWLPYFTKFRWQEIAAEQDPCKYASFPKRAGAELFQLVRRNASLAARLNAGQRGSLPPILAFQSLADDTVVPAGIAGTLREIGGEDDELTVFDLNRAGELAARLRQDDELSFADSAFAAGGQAPFTTTLVTNLETGSAAVEAWTWPAGSRPGDAPPAARRPLGERWPTGVVSLSHLALPLPPDDPSYGAATEPGAATPLGERGVLAPGAPVRRLRWNPFFDYMLRRMEERLPVASAPPPAAG